MPPGRRAGVERSGVRSFSRRYGSAARRSHVDRADLEIELYALTNVAFAHPRIASERTTVIVFRKESEFHAFAPLLVAGKYIEVCRTISNLLPVVVIAKG